MAPAELVNRWEAAYERYTQASEWADGAPQNPDAARAMADTSWEVAGLWRELAAVPDLQWWEVAALRTASTAFDAQSRHWQERTRQPPHRRPMPVERRG